MEKIAGIYLIISPINKFYVGQSWNVNGRLNGYKKLRAKGQPYLQNSLLKYGSDSHKFSIIEIYKGESQTELDKMEYDAWIKYSNLGYETLNCREPNGSRGKLSDETKLKLSILRKGRIAPNKGIKLTDEQKKNRPKTNIGKVCSMETKNKMRIANSGEKNSSAKLNHDLVFVIRELLSTNKMKQIEVAKLFNVSKQTISNIKLGLNWK